MNDRLGPLPGTPNHFTRNIEEASGARKSNLRHIPQSVATEVHTIRIILGVATDAGLVIVDSGAPWDHQRRISLFCGSSESDLEAERGMTFELADGTTTWACSFVWMQTLHGWFSTRFIEPTRVPIVVSIEGLGASQATVDFATNEMAHGRVTLFE